VLDGDGSVLMSMGTLPLIAAEAPNNLVHVALDNEAYESTGSQPSIATHVSLASVARASGYPGVWEADDRQSIEAAFTECESRPGPHFLLIKVSIAPIEDIPRVSHAPLEIRDRFRNGIEASRRKA
jgi:phosphonopyruvate decarboxylase